MTVSTPGRGSEVDDGAEVEGLYRLYLAGQFEPLQVSFPVTPLKPSPAMRAVLDDFAVIYGLRLAAEDDRPVAYGAEWAAARIGLPVRTVRRVLGRLVELGVLESCGELPARQRRGNGTRTYRPGGDPR